MHSVDVAPLPGEGEGTGVGVAPLPGEGEGTGVGGSPYCRHEHKHTLILPPTLLPRPLTHSTFLQRENAATCRLLAHFPLLWILCYNTLLSSGVSWSGLTPQ